MFQIHSVVNMGCVQDYSLMVLCINLSKKRVIYNSKKTALYNDSDLVQSVSSNFCRLPFENRNLTPCCGFGAYLYTPHHYITHLRNLKCTSPEIRTSRSDTALIFLPQHDELIQQLPPLNQRYTHHFPFLQNIAFLPPRLISIRTVTVLD